MDPDNYIVYVGSNGSFLKSLSANAVKDTMLSSLKRHLHLISIIRECHKIISMFISYATFVLLIGLESNPGVIFLIIKSIVSCL